MQTANHAALLDAGYEYLVRTRTFPGGWCKASKEDNALYELKGDWRSKVEDYGYAVYLVHPETDVEEVQGDFVHPVGHPPVLIKTVDGRKNRKVRNSG